MSKKQKQKQFRVINCNNCAYKVDGSCEDPGDLCKDFNAVALPQSYAALAKSFGELFPILSEEQMEFFNRCIFADMRQEAKRKNYRLRSGSCVIIKIDGTDHYGRVSSIGKKGVAVKLLGNKRFTSEAGSNYVVELSQRLDSQEVDYIVNKYLRDYSERTNIIANLKHSSVTSVNDQFDVFEKFFNEGVTKVHFKKIRKGKKKFYKTLDAFNFPKEEMKEFIQATGLKFSEINNCYYILQSNQKKLEAGLTLFNCVFVLQVKQTIDLPAKIDPPPSVPEEEEIIPSTIKLVDEEEKFVKREAIAQDKKETQDAMDEPEQPEEPARASVTTVSAQPSGVYIPSGPKTASPEKRSDTVVL